MNSLGISTSECFDRLQRLLLAMKVGDELCVSDAAKLSGLDQRVCLAMLEGLERAGLMTRVDAIRFVRCALDAVST